ncbi:FAD-binding oxidoreductase [Rhodococcus zopfii]|uniref:FAD-binding oxidoreductase n=1 Tax=Rhodococcus zopfii TaxID=43772 RepID=UPI0011114697|nr:2Fe-2S iron-sulfur cluster binding domain-containing protein [Rhodococcus zopfii]
MSLSPTEIRPGTSAGTGHCVRLNYADVTKEIVVPTGSTVLEAAETAGARLVNQCRIGTCGTCVGRVRTGELAMAEGRVYPLRSDEIGEGMRLLCQSHALAETDVDLDYPAAMLDDHPVVATTVKVAGLDRLADTVVELVVRLPKSPRFSFRPGQYVRFRIPGTAEWRSYSMASGQRHNRRLAFTIRLLPEGAMSDYLRNRAAVGDELEMEGPFGSFGLDEDSPGPVLMIAGGTGLAPMLSMLETLQTTRERHPIRLVFGCARMADLFHLDEIEARRGFTTGLDVRVVVDEPTDRSGILTGNPVSVLTPEDVADPRSSAYLCGPPAMLDAAHERLQVLGMPRDRIHSEQFLPS